MTAVHQVLAAAGPYDAVSGQAAAWRGLLTEAGYGGRDLVADAHPRTPPGFEPLAGFAPGRGELVVLRYSAWSPAFQGLLEGPARLLLVYHNITPAGYLWDHSAAVAAQCAVGRLQLPAFASGAAIAVADSDFNAAELREAGAEDVRVVPILFDQERYAERGEAADGAGPSVVSVGRIAPNKRHDLVLAAFAAYQREHAPDARLTCIGEPLTPAFGKLMADIVARSGARGVRFTGPVPQPAVNAEYAGADLLLHMSEHEGFCVPLLEAFHFGVPVVARPAGAMQGVGGDAVLWADGDPAVAAELMAMAVEDADLRTELVRRGRERLRAFSAERTAAAALTAVEDALR